jgi:hypothetical protein
MSESPSHRYVMPTTPMGRRLGRLSNSTVATLTRYGISLRGSRVLSVRGRKSGEWRSTPVNPLTYQGRRYLVSPRGQTQWVASARTPRTPSCWRSPPAIRCSRSARPRGDPATP